MNLEASEIQNGLPVEALNASVTGVGLSPGTLGDQLSEGLTLLVFLRHFGCMFCREMVSDLRSAAEDNADFPNVLFFSQASATEARAFMRRYWPNTRVVADPQLELYDLFGIPRAGFLEAIGPKVLVARSRARKKGLTNGPNSGDIWRMPGIFAVERDRIVWAHEAEHAADHPEFSRIPELIRQELE
jgi:hypothetical protein